MKKTLVARNVSVIIHLLYLLLGMVGFYGDPRFLRGPYFFVPMIYGSFLIATTFNVIITTLQHGKKQKAKVQQERLQTSFGTPDDRSELKTKTQKLSSLFWTLNGLLTLALSLLLIAFSFLQGVFVIFMNILNNGGSVDLLVYFKIGQALQTLRILNLVVFFILVAGLLASLVLRIVFATKAKKLTPQKEALEALNTENEEIPVQPIEEPINPSEPPESEVLEAPAPVAMPPEPVFEEAKPEMVPEEPKPIDIPVEAKPEAIPEAPTPVIETLEEKIRPEQIKPPKEEAEVTPEYLEEIKPILIKIKSKQMILNLPNPPTFIALPGLPNVAWVQDEALVIYFDYTSKIKSILEECVKNNPKKFPFASIDKIVLEGPEGRESTALYYRDKQASQKLVFPKACFEVLTRLVPNKAQSEPKKEEPKPNVVEEKKSEPAPTVSEPKAEATKQVPPPMIKPTPANPNDPEVRLAKLQKLYEKNIISKEEYDRKRKEILDTF